jgi:hypothetical protein
VLPAVAVPLGLNYAQGRGLLYRRLLDVLYENVNSGEELLRVNCTERIFIATGIHCKGFLYVRLLIFVRNRSVITGNTSSS